MNKTSFSVTSDAAAPDATPEQVILFLHSCGWNHVQPSVGMGQQLLERSSAERRKFRTWCASEGVTLEQGHLVNGVDLASSDPVRRRNDVDKEKRWCDLYEELGLIAGAVHPGTWDCIFGNSPREETMKYLAESLHELGEHTRNYRFKVCVENCPDSVKDADTLIRMVQSSGCDNIGYCYDSGHLNLAGADPAEFIRACGKKLLTLHLNDNSGPHWTDASQKGYWYGDDLHLFPGFFKHCVDWKKVIRTLHEVGYSHAYNFEIAVTCPSESYRKILMENYRRIAGEIFADDSAAAWWKKTDSIFNARNPLKREEEEKK